MVCSSSSHDCRSLRTAVRLMECANHILAQRVVHPRLAAHRRVHLGHDSGRHLQMPTRYHAPTGMMICVLMGLRCGRVQSTLE
jgi:hypothetical protein